MSKSCRYDEGRTPTSIFGATPLSYIGYIPRQAYRVHTQASISDAYPAKLYPVHILDDSGFILYNLVDCGLEKDYLVCLGSHPLKPAKVELVIYA